MNPVIEQHFDEVEVRLLQSLAIATYQIMTREIAFSDGKLRIKLVPRDGGMIELFEYVSESAGGIQLLK
ncbi:MAG: hypothetical protein ACE5IR_15920 [bacterium]